LPAPVDARRRCRPGTISTKHPGFREEREWRVVYIPSFEAAPHLNQQVQTLDGVAQTIYSLPLKSIPEIGFNAEVPQVLNRVIIGPSQGQAALKEELVRMLTEMAVPNPTDKIFLSDISLRDLP